MRSKKAKTVIKKRIIMSMVLSLLWEKPVLLTFIPHSTKKAELPGENDKELFFFLCSIESKSDLSFAVKIY